MDGLRAVFVVRNPTDKTAYAESVLQVTDWYQNPAHVDAPSFLYSNNDGAEPVPQSALINGVGQAYCAPGSACKYAVFPAKAGTCTSPMTKLRVVNTGGFGPFFLSIDNHLMRAVAVDTTPTVTSDAVSSLFVNVGERYDILVCPSGNGNMAGTKHWIRVGA